MLLTNLLTFSGKLFRPWLEQFILSGNEHSHFAGQAPRAREMEFTESSTSIINAAQFSKTMKDSRGLPIDRDILVPSTSHFRGTRREESSNFTPFITIFNVPNSVVSYILTHAPVRSGSGSLQRRPDNSATNLSPISNASAAVHGDISTR